MRHRTFVSPREDADTISRWGVELLESLLRIDSQGDADSEKIPSTSGQERLAAHLESTCRAWGLDSRRDSSGNLIVTIPASRGAENSPHLALMTHLDTSRGTRPIERLGVVPAWDGARVRYPSNADLTVTSAGYPSLAWAVGEDLLHGPGDFPVGLDNKLGMAEVLTLAKILVRSADIPRGELALVFRPDEEIGRMEAVVGLAEELSRRGVSYGYTVDGIVPFEVNMENFNASSARVVFPAQKTSVAPARAARRVTLSLTGVAAHGAVAKEEGYLNATVIAARALAAPREGELLEDFASDRDKETNASLTFVLLGASNAELDSRQCALMEAFEREVSAHEWKGARVTVIAHEDIEPPREIPAAPAMILDRIRAFMAGDGPRPLLAEDSEGYEGYSNPHSVSREGDGMSLYYRLRAFTPAELSKREDAIRKVSGGLEVEITRQYVNMGPHLAAHGVLFDWAAEAARLVGAEAVRRPIRGGTGVDPFLERGIPIANLGTGYFAPESEKELTTVQNIGRHALWLTGLVQVVAGQKNR